MILLSFCAPLTLIQVVLQLKEKPGVFLAAGTLVFLVFFCLKFISITEILVFSENMSVNKGAAKRKSYSVSNASDLDKSKI